LKGYINKPLD